MGKHPDKVLACFATHVRHLVDMEEEGAPAGSTRRAELHERTVSPILELPPRPTWTGSSPPVPQSPFGEGDLPRRGLLALLRERRQSEQDLAAGTFSGEQHPIRALAPIHPHLVQVALEMAGSTQTADLHVLHRPEDLIPIGLGLSIVAAVVSAHRGRVHAEALPAGGLAVTVELPAAAVAPLPEVADLTR